MLPPTHMAELAATTAPVFQLVLQGALTVLQTELVERLTAHLAIHKLQGKGQVSRSAASCSSCALQLFAHQLALDGWLQREREEEEKVFGHPTLMVWSPVSHNSCFKEA